MAKYVFTATHGVQFSEDGSEAWAVFALDSEAGGLESGEAARVYRFETDDAAVAARLRKVDDYGIAEVKAAKTKSG